MPGVLSKYGSHNSAAQAQRLLGLKFQRLPVSPFSCAVFLLTHEGGNPLVVQLTPTWEKPFSCAVSMLTPTGGKPFSCRVCGKVCSGKSDSKDSKSHRGKNLLVAQFLTKVVVK